MSKPSFAGREQQQSSPFGLRHKQAKKAQKIKKYGANAPQLHANRCSIDFCVMRCNEQAKKQKNTAKMRHICTIFFLRGESYPSSSSCRDSWGRINTTDAFGLRKRSKTASGSQ